MIVDALPIFTTYHVLNLVIMDGLDARLDKGDPTVDSPTPVQNDHSS
jgi:hypothetical protein